jgi:predicted outer membrane protein
MTPAFLPTTSRRAALLAGTALLAGCATGWRDQVGATSVHRDAWLPLMQAAGAGMAAAEAGRLGLARASDPGVRAWSEALVAHHEAAQLQLEALLAERGARPPAQLPGRDAARLGRLAVLPPGDFDRWFVAAVGIDDQRRAIGLVEQGLREVRDPGLQGWFAALLPVLQAQLAQARQLHARLSA